MGFMVLSSQTTGEKLLVRKNRFWRLTVSKQRFDAAQQEVLLTANDFLAQDFAFDVESEYWECRQELPHALCKMFLHEKFTQAVVSKRDFKRFDHCQQLLKQLRASGIVDLNQNVTKFCFLY